MKSHLELIAEKFCAECFANAKLDSNQFMGKINELVNTLGPIEEKLIVLNEVIRIGKKYCHTNAYLIGGVVFKDFHIFPTAN